ncbi:alpha/beta hydrolase [Jannaschia sp. 2305UL9-9]|uniref:alpha/beta hydrolase n=1 Tax=Jannaschia sp. 2305UL9-9 TaxID=3121638 RepID=UPI0035270B98
MTDHGFTLSPQPPMPVAVAEAYTNDVLMASRGGWPGVREMRDQRFGPEPWQVFDVFMPDGPAPDGGRDIVIFIHGGGWSNGWKEMNGFMAPGITATDAILIAPTHRLTPHVRYPAMLHDVLDDVAAVRARAADYGGNPDRIIMAGHSAGGHLALLAALRTDLWADHGLPPGAIAACAPMSAALQLHHPDPVPGSLEARVYTDLLADPADDKDASPMNWLENLDMPLFLSWGDRDMPRVRSSNPEALAKLEAAGKPATHAVYPTDHFETHQQLIDPDHDWYASVTRLRKDIP